MDHSKEIAQCPRKGALMEELVQYALLEILEQILKTDAFWAEDSLMHVILGQRVALVVSSSWFKKYNSVYGTKFRLNGVS